MSAISSVNSLFPQASSASACSSSVAYSDILSFNSLGYRASCVASEVLSAGSVFTPPSPSGSYFSAPRNAIPLHLRLLERYLECSPKKTLVSASTACASGELTPEGFLSAIKGALNSEEEINFKELDGYAYSDIRHVNIGGGYNALQIAVFYCNHSLLKWCITNGVGRYSSYKNLADRTALDFIFSQLQINRDLFEVAIPCIALLINLNKDCKAVQLDKINQFCLYNDIHILDRIQDACKESRNDQQFNYMPHRKIEVRSRINGNIKSVFLNDYQKSLIQYYDNDHMYLDLGVPKNLTKDMNGANLLAIAAFYQNFELMKKALDSGLFTLYDSDDKGNTILFYLLNGIPLNSEKTDIKDNVKSTIIQCIQLFYGKNIDLSYQNYDKNQNIFNILDDKPLAFKKFIMTHLKPLDRGSEFFACAPAEGTHESEFFKDLEVEVGFAEFNELADEDGTS